MSARIVGKRRAVSVKSAGCVPLLALWLLAGATIPARASEGTSPALALTEAEQTFLHDKSLRLGIDPTWPPFEFRDRSGHYAGIGSDVVQAVSRRLGITMTPEPGLTWTMVLDRVKRGELDVIPVITPTEQRRQFLQFTRPYMSFPAVIVTREHGRFVGGLEDLSGVAFGVVKGYIVEEYLRRDHPQLQPTPYIELEKGLQDVATGKVEAFVDNLASVAYTIDHLGLANLKVAAPTPYRFDLAMGVRKDWPPEAVAALDKALESLNDQEKSAIKNRWLSVRFEYGIDPRALLRWGMVVGLAVIVLGLITLIWYKRLQRWNRTLRESESRFRAIIDASPIPSALNDNQQNITYINPAFIRTFGYIHTEITTLAAWWPKAYPDPAYRFWVIQEWGKRVAQAQEQGAPFRAMEVRIHCKDDKVKTVLAEAVELQGVQQHLVTLFDITELKQTQQTLQDILQERAEFLKRIPVGVYKWRSFPDGRSRFDFVSPTWCLQLGVSEEAVMQDARVAFQVIHPED
ncbi:MAG: transporter substrate-binding domain-containing protein, partial [Magnetococcales bacterium]|nr:transporter substrate-binding domain-containing protein [Magnetococcales bacterium]